MGWLLAAAAFLCCASPALASSGAITTATVNSDWTAARIAGTAQWDACPQTGECYWRPYLTFQPDTPEYECDGREAFEIGIDPNLRSAWPVPAQSADGSVEFDLSGIETLAGVQGQRVCLNAVYFHTTPAGWCQEQHERFPEVPCFEGGATSVDGLNLASTVPTAEPPPVPPASSGDSVSSAAGALASDSPSPAPKQCRKGWRLAHRDGKAICVKRRSPATARPSSRRAALIRPAR
jgi:hypothetical protein